MNPRIGKLEALLARIQKNAAAPRVAAVAAAPAPAPSPVEAAAAVEVEPSAPITAPPPPESAPSFPGEARDIEAPLESRARLVAAPRTEIEVEEIEAEEVLELDDRHIVDEAAAAPEVEVSLGEPQAEEPEAEAPPPSSRRPIAEPAESPQEARIQVAHTPPPESGKQVASTELSFDDDFTGVREAAQAPRPVQAPASEPSIQLQSLRMPAVKPPSAPDEMEAEIPAAGEEETRPPPSPLPATGGPGPLPEMRAPRIESAPQPEPTQVSREVSAEVTRPTRPVAPAEVAQMAGTVKPESPKTFGELLELTLSL